MIQYLTLFLVFLPQISFPYLTISGLDNQPISFLFAFIYFCVNRYYERSLKVSVQFKWAFCILFAIFLLSVISVIISTSGSYEVLHQLSMIKSCVTYLMITFIFLFSGILNDPKKIANTLYFVSLSMLVASLAHYFRLSFIFDPFIARIPDLDAVRGARSLFSEPSFVPSISSLYILLIYLFRNYVSTVRFLASISALAISSLLSLSGQLIVVACLAFISFLISISISLVVALLRSSVTKSFLRFLLIFLISIITLCSSFLVAISLNFSSRVFVILDKFLLGQSVFDSSSLVRVHTMFFPFNMPFYRPFDLTMNKAHVLTNIEYSSFYSAYTDFFQLLTSHELPIYPLKLYSIAGNVTFDFGFLGLILLAIFLFLLLRNFSFLLKSSEAPIFLERSFTIYLLLFSFINLSLLTVPFWFISGVILSYKRSFFATHPQLILKHV